MLGVGGRGRRDCGFHISLSNFPTTGRKGLKQTSFLNDSGKHFFAVLVLSPHPQEFCL